jgi:hypothetical protein
MLQLITAQANDTTAVLHYIARPTKIQTISNRAIIFLHDVGSAAFLLK